MAHQAGAYPSFSSMKRLGVFLLPPGWDASPSQGYPQHQIRRYPFIHLGGERHCESEVSCPRTQHNNFISPARARTRSARSGVERTNHAIFSFHEIIISINLHVQKRHIKLDETQNVHHFQCQTDFSNFTYI